MNAVGRAEGGPRPAMRHVRGCTTLSGRAGLRGVQPWQPGRRSRPGGEDAARRRAGLQARVLCVAIAVLASATLARPALAYRPFDGTDADVAGLGELELELGPAHYFRQGHADSLIVPAVVLNVGVVERVELVADFKNFVSIDGSDTGLRRLHPRDSDVLIKVVLRRGLLQAETGPSVALESGVLLPTADAQHGFGAQANTIISFGSRETAIHLNESIADSRDQRLELFSSAIVEIQRAATVHPVAELFIDSVVGRGIEYSALAGAIWAAAPDWVFDVAIRAARADGQPTLEVRLGFTWTTPVWRADHAN